MLTSVWRISYEAHVQLAIDWILGFDLLGLGMMEDEIFKKRHQDELEFQRRQKELKRRKQIRHQRQHLKEHSELPFNPRVGCDHSGIGCGSMYMW